MCHICERSGTFGTGLLREHRVMEQGAAPETDATLQTFDAGTLRNASTAAPIVAYGYGAGESLRSLQLYAKCPPEVTMAAVTMGITYGTVTACTVNRGTPAPNPPVPRVSPDVKCMFSHPSNTN